MPIRINLLAEAQAEEESRRKDPVKRAVWIGGFVVFVAVLWAFTLQLKVFTTKSDLTQLQSRWKNIEKNYQSAVDNNRKLGEAEQKLNALASLTTNRFLWGNALNAFQQTLNGVEDVQVMRFRTEQAYALTEEVKSRTNGTQVLPGKPGFSTEKIVLTIEATDASTPPGGQVNRFKESIAQVPYFQNNLQKTNGVLLTTLSPPQVNASGQNSVMFTMQCFFPEKVRH